ncbi:hypothetical protein P154DRAFT_579002 [Amniculicola lignicola CBS 123094]|uniref:Uncharacterized protein n=1 Tax=Amniculicola lignicola CBS 123094 TaxID=1392246 RepID=A0A6A5WE17_9PLEO|nr:hypothetical protein P154DRAFT_579002 [Amniculicola lignicola CBS 123094]
MDGNGHNAAVSWDDIPFDITPPPPTSPSEENFVTRTEINGWWVERLNAEGTLKYAYSIRRHIRINLKLIKDYGMDALSTAIKEVDPNKPLSEDDEEESSIEIIQQRFAYHHVGISETLLLAGDVCVRGTLPGNRLFRGVRNYFGHKFTTADANTGTETVAFAMKGLKEQYEELLKVVENTIKLLQPILKDEEVWETVVQKVVVDWGLSTGNGLTETGDDPTVVEGDDDSDDGKNYVEDSPGATDLCKESENLYTQDSVWYRCPNCGYEGQINEVYYEDQETTGQEGLNSDSCQEAFLDEAGSLDEEEIWSDVEAHQVDPLALSPLEDD